MKLLKSVKAPTARKRLISFALAVTTLLTALVVLPVTLPVTEVGAYTADQIYNLWGEPGPYASITDAKPNNHVYYASQWAGELSNGNKTYLFSGENATGVMETDNYYHYHQNTKSFIFRYDANGNSLDPYVTFRLPDQNRFDASDYKYITVTYSIHTEDWVKRTDQNLKMALYPMTSNHDYPSEDLTLTAENIVVPETRVSSDAERIYHTVTFDLSNQSKWTGKVRGFRFDYFNGYEYTDSNEKKHTTDAGDNYDANIYHGMVIFVDSFGFFKTKEEADHHADERAIARNYYVNNENENYKNRNIYRATSQAWGGYIPTNNVRLLQQNTEFHYDESERAYKMSVTGDYKDPYFSFLIDGNVHLNRVDHAADTNNSRPADSTQDIRNSVNRSLSNEYKYVAIVYKVNDATKWQAVNNCHMTISLLYNVGTSNNDADYDRAANINGSAESISLNEIDFDTSRYHTIVFYVGDFLEYIAGKGKEARVNGFRLDYINGREYFWGAMDPYVEGSAIYIDSIGFFKTQKEAEALSRTPVHLEGSTMDTDETQDHNMEATQVAGGLKLTAQRSCTGTHIMYHAECDHLNQYQNDPASREIAIDPIAAVTFEDMSLPTKDYQYIVVTYTIPKDIFLPEVSPKYDCPCKQPNCPNTKRNLYYYEDVAEETPRNPAFSLLSLFLLYKGQDGEKIYAKEDYRVDELLYEKNQGVSVRCILRLDAMKSDDLKEFVGIRFDPFNYHYAKNGSYIIIQSVDIFASEKEAYGGYAEDEYKDSYAIKVSVDTALPEGTPFPDCFTNAAITPGQSSPNGLADLASFDIRLEEKYNYFRAHWEFVGWEAYYRDGTNDQNNPTRVYYDPGNGTRVFKPGDTLDPTFDETHYTTRTTTIGGKTHMTLEIVLTPVWTPSKQLLTISPPSDAESGECIYRITGTTVLNEQKTLDVAAGANGSVAGNVSVWLPDGTYTVQMLTDWGWRYVDPTPDDGKNETIQKGIPVSQYVQFPDGKDPENPAAEHKGNGIFLMTVENQARYYKVVNITDPTCSFYDLTSQNNSWLNGYGYVTSATVPQNPTP